MSKRRMIEILTAELSRAQRALDAYRNIHGPESWGDFPHDSIAAHRVGYIAGLQAACREIKKAKG